MRGEEHNPYAAPRAAVELDEAPPPPASERSSAPLVFGVLSLCFSGLVVMLMSSTILFAAIARKERAPQQVLAERVADGVTRRPRDEPPAGALALIGLSFCGGSIALLVIGVGQVRYRRWAARASVGWSVVAPGLLIAGIAWAATVAPLPAAALAARAFLLLPYPILLLVFFTRQRVIASMR